MSVENETPEEHERRRKDESSKALKWLADHWTQSRTCPICGHTAWSVGQILEIREFNNGNLVIGGDSQITPLSPVMCQNCGYTFFMNAIRSGAISTEMPSEKTSGDEKEPQA